MGLAEERRLEVAFAVVVLWDRWQAVLVGEGHQIRI